MCYMFQQQSLDIKIISFKRKKNNTQLNSTALNFNSIEINTHPHTLQPLFYTNFSPFSNTLTNPAITLAMPSPNKPPFVPGAPVCSCSAFMASSISVGIFKKIFASCRLKRRRPKTSKYERARSSCWMS